MLEMMMGGKHGRKRRVQEIVCIFLGLFIVSSLFLTLTSGVSRQRGHSTARLHADRSSNFASSETKALKAGDRTLGGLLRPPQAFEPGQTCTARWEESLIRKPSPHRPSPYLITKLREYESRHKRCAPHAVNFSQNGSNAMPEGCQFVVWIANSGLGNRMITIASAFVYALLTDRVLLLDHNGTDVDGLFCEPFPGTSWLLPESYDYEWMGRVVWENDHRLGRLLQESGNVTLPARVPHGYVFANLMHNSDEHDRRFFCAAVQRQLQAVPLLYWRSNLYVVPGLHFVRPFHGELDRMFPERHTVFHHVARYLFRPSNPMWGAVLRFRQPHLAQARHQVGLQLRILEDNVTAAAVADQLLACVLENKILPRHSRDAADKDDNLVNVRKTGSTAVLVTSLDTAYHRKLQDYYLDGSAEGADYVGVHAPSNEQTQQFGPEHDRKAWGDMYLLSLSDALVTSPQSTFGYVAQALAGAVPWILTRVEDQGDCRRGLSVEPCFHAPPPLECQGRGPGFARPPASIFPSFIQPCEDVQGGIKIIPSIAAPGDDDGDDDDEEQSTSPHDQKVKIQHEKSVTRRR